MLIIQKKFKNKVIGAGFWYTVGNYMLKGISFLTIPVFSRLLAPEDYGKYNTYIAYESILYLFIGLTLHTSLKNAKYKYKDEYANYCSSCISLIIVNFIFFMLISILFQHTVSFHTGFSNIIILLLVFHSFSTAILTFYNTYAGLDYQYKMYLRLSLMNALSNIILSIIFILTIQSFPRYISRILGTAIPLFFITIYLITYFYKNSRQHLNISYWKYGLKYSIPLIPHGLSQVILSQIDRLMINNMVGSYETGIYSFAYNIYNIIFLTSSSIGTVWEPWFYEMMNQKEYTLIKSQTNKYIYGMSLLSLIAVLISPELILILGGQKYLSAKYIVIPIILGGFFTFLYTIPVCLEYYLEKTTYIALATATAALINFILNYIYIKKYGYKAAAYTTFITYFLYFLFHYAFSWFTNSKEKIFDTKFIIRTVIINITVSFFSCLFINIYFARWILAVILAIHLIHWLYKELL